MLLMHTLASNLGQNSFIQIKCRSSWADYKHFKSNSTFFQHFRRQIVTIRSTSGQVIIQIKLKMSKKEDQIISKASKGAERGWKELKKSSKRSWRWSLVSGFLILDTWPLRIATYYLTSNLIKSGSFKRYH